MINVLLYDLKKSEIQSGGEELISQWQSNPQSLIWVDFVGADTDHEKNLMSDVFGLHPLAVQDAQRNRHPPKLETFNEFTFLLLKCLGTESEDFKFSTIQLAVFIGRNYLITRHWEASPSVQQAYNEVVREPQRFVDGLDAIAVRLARMVVNRYLKLLLLLEPRLEELESTITDNPSDDLLAELINLKTELKKFRRVFIYHQQVFADLKNNNCPEIHKEHIHEIVDVYEQQERTASLADLYHELASDLIDGYISVASHRLNNIMKILTIVTTIFVPLSFLAGIYGMNFENMPELHSKSGYFILLSIMGFIMFLLLAVFRKFRWI
ncbi:magnesium/cobalt transporter CorA [Kaarinaea lacus]